MMILKPARPIRRPRTLSLILPLGVERRRAAMLGIPTEITGAYRRAAFRMNLEETWTSLPAKRRS